LHAARNCIRVRPGRKSNDPGIQIEGKIPNQFPELRLRNDGMSNVPNTKFGLAQQVKIHTNYAVHSRLPNVML